ncbi:hypothetical protein EG878_17605 [Enterococcus faecalis]|nr:hypothetical protein EG878_17605 [Enterococcus faecalis]
MWHRCPSSAGAAGPGAGDRTPKPRVPKRAAQVAPATGAPRRPPNAAMMIPARRHPRAGAG